MSQFLAPGSRTSQLMLSYYSTESANWKRVKEHQQLTPLGLCRSPIVLGCTTSEQHTKDRPNFLFSWIWAICRQNTSCHTGIAEETSLCSWLLCQQPCHHQHDLVKERSRSGWLCCLLSFWLICWWVIEMKRPGEGQFFGREETKRTSRNKLFPQKNALNLVKLLTWIGTIFWPNLVAYLFSTHNY